MSRSQHIPDHVSAKIDDATDDYIKTLMAASPQPLVIITLVGLAPDIEEIIRKGSHFVALQVRANVNDDLIRVACAGVADRSTEMTPADIRTARN